MSKNVITDGEVAGQPTRVVFKQIAVDRAPHLVLRAGGKYGGNRAAHGQPRDDAVMR
jgi:hypothetical protein